MDLKEYVITDAQVLTYRLIIPYPPSVETNHIQNNHRINKTIQIIYYLRTIYGRTTQSRCFWME